MAFFKEPSDNTVARSMGVILGERILTIGGKVKPGAGRRWQEDFEKLIDKHGENLVSRVLEEYCLRIQDTSLPRIRSGKSFRKHFDNLLYRTDAGLVDRDFESDKVPRNLIRLILLRWPFDDKRELNWACIIYQDILEQYPNYTKQQQMHLGPPKQVLNQWRLRANSYAWANGCRGFHDLWFGGADDLFVTQMLRDLL